MDFADYWKLLTPIYEAGEAKAIVRLLFEERYHLSMADILCGKVTELSADDQAELEKIMQRLEKGEPVQYILGHAMFCGRSFHVNDQVLIPRPETEELCRWIIDRYTTPASPCSHPRVLDVGTGSGCIAATLALDIPGSQVTGWDISLQALDVARGNVAALGARATVEIEDALMPRTDERQWDLIVSNPPYIMTSERATLPINVRDYEPEMALFAPGEFSALFYIRITNYACDHLRHGGELFFELNPLTADRVCEHLTDMHFTDIEVRKDQFGKIRFLRAVHP